MSQRTPYRPEGLVGTPSSSAAGLGVRGWARWMWRQLTSMRVAIMLLLMLAIAALPGAFFPQRPQAPEQVAQYYSDHPDLAPWLHRLGLFDVYASTWFAAIYLLLFVSLIGCIVPRTVAHARALRTPPPRAPRRFTRFEHRMRFERDGQPADLAGAARRALRGYRVRLEEEASSGEGRGFALSAEKGYAREAGNLLFHLALVGVLVSMALGSLVHYRGQVILVEGRSFANSQLAYDTFSSGSWFSASSLDPFRFTLDGFDAVFTEAGAARDFTAHLTVIDTDGTESTDTVKVNHPLRVGEAAIFLMGNGFAPTVTVRDADGVVAFSGSVPFIPQDDWYTSLGVVKVPDVSGDQPQLGFNGVLLPSAVIDPTGEFAISVDPRPNDPHLVLQVWEGDLGLDDGFPQNVYRLVTDAMEPVPDPEDADGQLRIVLALGEEVQLPDGRGSISFDALPRFVGLDLRYDPTTGWVLAFAILAFAGLAASLFLPRRRIWVRLTDGHPGRTVVGAAALARGDDPGLARELDRVLAALGAPAGASVADAAARRSDREPR